LDNPTGRPLVLTSERMAWSPTLSVISTFREFSKRGSSPANLSLCLNIEPARQPLSAAVECLDPWQLSEVSRKINTDRRMIL
jgi:hypothetical protein